MPCRVWSSLYTRPKAQEVIYCQASVDVCLCGKHTGDIVDASVDAMVVDCISWTEATDVIGKGSIFNTVLGSHSITTEACFWAKYR